MHCKCFSPSTLLSSVLQGKVDISASVLPIHKVLSLLQRKEITKISLITIKETRPKSTSSSKVTNCQHCQGGMHQNECRTAGINSCQFCCSNGIRSYGEVGTTIALHSMQLDSKLAPSP